MNAGAIANTLYEINNPLFPLKLATQVIGGPKKIQNEDTQKAALEQELGVEGKGYTLPQLVLLKAIKDGKTQPGLVYAQQTPKNPDTNLGAGLSKLIEAANAQDGFAKQATI